MISAMDGSESLSPYFRGERLLVVPRRRAPRLAVLDLLASQFEPGHYYPEAVVNEMLSRFHPDYCAMRRYLVEEGFMARGDGIYWRAGGTVEVD
jgi:hypothetical protein